MRVHVNDSNQWRLASKVKIYLKWVVKRGLFKLSVTQPPLLIGEAYELTTFAQQRRWTAWQAYCACLSGHLPASRQSQSRCWQQFAGVLEKAGGETNFQSFPYTLQRIFPDNSSITLVTCSLHMFSIRLSVFIAVSTRRINTIASCRQR